MKIGEYIDKYTIGNRIGLKYVLMEARELVVELFRFDKKGISEEFQDVLHFLQLWLCWRFGINGEIWKSTQRSVDKFIARVEAWKKIYKYVGLGENISGYAGNYQKIEKVVNHLQKFGIRKDLAENAYQKIVLNK